MKKVPTLIKSVAFVSLFLIVLSTTYKIASTGAPIGSTGAPGEATCAKSGCHDDHAINAGEALLNISVEGNPGNYTPGKVYHFSISVRKSQTERFGFALAALRPSNGLKCGELIITDSLKTQRMTGSNQYTGREYVTYTSRGTGADAAGYAIWQFDWKAPEQNEGPVTFYLASVAANNDGTDNGDEVYTQKFILNGMNREEETK